jgi:uncharacterized OsmC-like protein
VPVTSDDVLIDRPALRSVVEDTTAKLRGNPKGGVIRPAIESRLVHDVSAEASWEQSGRVHTIRSDEAPGRGGLGEHPTAIRYFLSGIAFCLQVWYAKASALADVPISDVRLRVEAALDMRIEYGLDPAPGPQFVLVTARVVSPASSDAVRAVALEAHRRCPLSNLVERAVPIYLRVHHAGSVIHETVPAELRDLLGTGDRATDPDGPLHPRVSVG